MLAAMAAAPASAADLPVRAAPAPVYTPAPTFTWTGFYIGTNVGAVVDNSDIVVVPSGGFLQEAPIIVQEFQRQLPRRFSCDDDGNNFGLLDDDDCVGYQAGVQAGFNWQTGMFVFGAEADIQYVAHQSRFHTITELTFPLAGIHDVDVEHSVNWYGTVRGRVGLAFDRFLVYGTGGFAYGEVETGALITGTQPFFFQLAGSRSDTRTGWTAGGGLEWAVTDTISLKAEYLYVDLSEDDENGFLATPVGPNAPLVQLITPGASYTVTDETKFHVFRTGVNLKFNLFAPPPPPAPAPVVTKG